MKIVLDTNVLVSALTTRGLCTELFEQILQQQLLATSTPILMELERILSEKFSLPPEIVLGYLDLLKEESEWLAVAAENLTGIPDPDDVEILAYACGSKADIFATGDKALLNLKTIGEMHIISPRACWEKLRAVE